MLPDTLEPKISGPHGPAAADLCRLSPDHTRIAFAAAGHIYLDAATAHPGASAKRLWTGANETEITDLAFSGDGHHLAFTTPSRLIVLRLVDANAAELPGRAFAWAGAGSTLLVADPANRRLYMRDMDLDLDIRVGEIAAADAAAAADPDAPPPILSVSPDHRRFALVTRHAQGDDTLTRIDLAQHDGRQWQIDLLSEMPGRTVRIRPFWSADSAAFAMLVVDPAQHHTAIVAVPPHEQGEGDVLYTSDSVDALVTPAAHPDGRLIAMVRAHPRDDVPTLVEPRLVLVDPVEQSVAALTTDPGIVGHLRWIDPSTLLVEGGPGIWTVRLRATEQEAPDDPVPADAAAADPATPVLRTVIQDPDPRFSFACDIPAGWQRLPFPPATDVDFADRTAMRPLCVFTPTYAALAFTVATRPTIPGTPLPAALAFLSESQGLAIEPVRALTFPDGSRGVETFATSGAAGDAMRMRLRLIEHQGNLFSLAVIAPSPLWEGARPMLDRMLESFQFLPT